MSLITISGGAEALYALSRELEDLGDRFEDELLRISIIDAKIEDLRQLRNAAVRTKMELNAKVRANRDTMAKIITANRKGI